jgi:hypothetical protein
MGVFCFEDCPDVIIISDIFEFLRNVLHLRLPGPMDHLVAAAVLVSLISRGCRI